MLLETGSLHTDIYSSGVNTISGLGSLSRENALYEDGETLIYKHPTNLDFIAITQDNRLAVPWNLNFNLDDPVVGDQTPYTLFPDGGREIRKLYLSGHGISGDFIQVKINE